MSLFAVLAASNCEPLVAALLGEQHGLEAIMAQLALYVRTWRAKGLTPAQVDM